MLLELEKLPLKKLHEIFKIDWLAYTMDICKSLAVGKKTATLLFADR